MINRPIAFRASLLDFIDDPQREPASSFRYIEDGLLVVEDGLVTACGEFGEVKQRVPNDLEIQDYRPHLIMPGFIDMHAHYVQTDMIASPSVDLLDWLKTYTYPTEARFSNREVADETARFFIQQLLANGTTTAMVFASSHPQSVDAVFDAAAMQKMRLIAGKVMMDRHAPPTVCDSAQSSYDDSLALIRKWHRTARMLYAVTPRFAPTSSEAQLKVAQQLVNEFPDVYLQSHVAENREEVDWVAELFPWSRSYLDVYDHFGLLGDRAVYAHCLHLDDQDRRSLLNSGAAMAFCPSSNLFLGSGLLDWQRSTELDIRTGLGTDVGAGTSFSLLKTMHDAYRVGRMQAFHPSPLYFFYLATLGAARALYLDDRIGNFQAGKEADFIVIDAGATELMSRRVTRAQSLEELLFVLMILGDERNVIATHILGECRYSAAGVSTAGDSH